ncbi:uncharacterized protein LOC132904375 [Amyelois transitella]|uniref:uncharacterized protein LOC132903940 n=1 Tax=Amyelois transitella TaxID=680683 RepID=UPI0029907F79|nr:uncharacterized protein LOC132903940 [Amyelois transitella]XP_060810137.1 uncharacterized protein LOC132904233 [Amyelois transitella]XP_060810590.1 uncharacterized protein LOC132904375 [Amyelois transitella]
MGNVRRNYVTKMDHKFGAVENYVIKTTFIQATFTDRSISNSEFMEEDRDTYMAKSHSDNNRRYPLLQVSMPEEPRDFGVIGKLSFAWKGRFKISWRQLKESERISDLSKL